MMRALVIDDSRPIRGIIAKIMRSLKFETIEAGNGAEAWGILSEQGPFDVVTVNWEMPEMDGVQFATKVRRAARFRSMPLLMISSISDTQQIELARQTGVDDYIVKPCTLGAITKKLRSLGVIADHPVASDATNEFGKDTVDKGTRLAVSTRETPSSKGETPNPSTSKKVENSAEQAVRSVRRAASSFSGSTGKTIRVLVVDDSSIVRNVIKTSLESAGGFSVIAGAADGIEGLQLVESLKPDVVLLDVEMPRMDGLEMLRQMRQSSSKVPVVMFSSRTERGAKATTDALLLGAKDFVFKPGGPRMTDVKAGEDVIRNQIAPRLKWLCDRGRSIARTESSRSTTDFASKSRQSIQMVVVAASTGGPAALATLFHEPNLRNNLSQPILVVQHMPALFTKYLASRLAEETGLDIAEAGDGEILKPGMIRIAPGGYHLVVKRDRTDYLTSITCDEAVNSCRPSADVLFESAAKEVVGGVLGVILTGMGHDGREGCRAIRNSGGTVLAQDEASSVVWGMPGSVVAAGLADHIMAMNLIGKKVSSYLKVGA